MAGITFSARVSKSECFSGITVFELSQKAEHRFQNVKFANGNILRLEPVHYKYVNPFAEHPQKYAVLGEHRIQGTTVTLF